MDTDEREEIGQLYREHGPMIMRRILRFYDRTEAEEVFHEVFVKIIERRDAFRNESAVSTWLYRVATNHCINRLRDSKRRTELLMQHAEGGFLGAHRGADAPTRLLCKQLWRQLDDELLQIFVYYHVDGMTHGEIASLLDVSRRTVGNRLAELADRARAHGGGSSI